MSRREFHFVEGTSSKFWAIDLSGASFTVNWGRIGTGGQTQTKEFASDAEAKKQHDKLVAEKVKKGYSEIGAPASAASIPAAVAGAKAAKKSGEVKTAPPPPPPPVVNLKVERSVDLPEVDWRIATWRIEKWQARPLPEPRPFDKDACVGRLRKARIRHWFDTPWEKLGVDIGMSPAEAEFWLNTSLLQQDARMINAGKGDLGSRLADRVAKGKYTGRVSLDKIRQAWKKLKWSRSAQTLTILLRLLPMKDLVAFLCDDKVLGEEDVYEALTWHFGSRILPYLGEPEVRKLKAALRPLLKPADFPTGEDTVVPPAFAMAARLGMHEELRKVVESWPDGSFTGRGFVVPQLLILGLGSAELVEMHMRRLKLSLVGYSGEDLLMRGWLAHTQWHALDVARDAALAETNRGFAEKLVRCFCRVNAPEAAQHVLQLQLDSKAPAVAREWLDRNVGNAIAGLVGVAAGPGKLGAAALEYLRDARARGHAKLIKECLASVPAEAAERVKRDVLEYEEKQYPVMDEKAAPKWLSEAKVKAARPPAWVPLTKLPPVLVDGKRLGETYVQAVVAAMQTSTLAEPHPLLKDLRQKADRESVDALAWKLFDLWLGEGAPSKEKWAMLAIGFLGGDASALKLTPMVRNWPGESQHARAVVGLECLRAIGTDTALMCLNGISQKLKFQGLKAKAREMMEAIAADRGMTRAQLEDRVVPDCDLDERGTRLFDFGSRQFRFVFGPDMKPAVKDAEGKVKSDLPAPGSKDDAAKAKEAVEAWKLLKKQIREVAKIQAERLEQAMVTGRRWSAKEFELLLVKHPLMINFVRLVLWAGYDAKGKLATTFRVTEDQTYADSGDEAMKLTGVEQVGIVHPLHLTDEQKRAWGEVFSDYEIVPPFAQIGRPVFGLEKDEGKASEIKRFAKIEIPATALVGTLERLAWVRGIPQDAGVFYEHTKPFPGADVTAVVQYEQGVPVGYMEGWEDQKITECFFIPGLYAAKMYPDHKKRLKLGEVDAVAVSEVLKDLTLIASKGK